MPDSTRPVQELSRLMSKTKPTRPGDYLDDDPHGAMQLALEQLRSEYPGETSKVKVAPFRFLHNIMPDGMVAATFPDNTIMYNPSMVSRDQGENQDTLAHELVHARQNMQSGRGAMGNFMRNMMDGLQNPYADQPREQEAFDEMDKRTAKRRDIYLPSDK